jgi:NAD(P)-dependent dehydrogenase (short-subunit alcohol dehydrogenase family)
MVTQAMRDLLRAAENPRIVNVTSQMGSLARKRSGGDYSYTASKAALNMLTKALAYDYRREGITVVAIHPGWVQTDMGGAGAPLSPEESARRIREIVDRLTPDDAARYLQVNGKDLPW